MKRFAILAVVWMCAAGVSIEAQRGRGGGGGGPAASPRQAAPIDLAGYWVSPIIEDWKYRMVTPNKGVFDGVPVSAEGRRVGESWDAAKDEAAGEQCRAYGAAAIMRLPGRIHITWQDDTTLKVETDTGTQTRLLRFGPAAAPAEASWQGSSAAEWKISRGSGGARAGSLKVITTNLRAGYLRKNGVPYSNRTTVTEYWDLNEAPGGEKWLTVTTKVEDPVYLARPYLTSSDFRKLPGAAGWNPSPCEAR